MGVFGRRPQPKSLWHALRRPASENLHKSTNASRTVLCLLPPAADIRTVRGPLARSGRTRGIVQAACRTGSKARTRLARRCDGKPRRIGEDGLDAARRVRKPNCPSGLRRRSRPRICMGMMNAFAKRRLAQLAQPGTYELVEVRTRRGITKHCCSPKRSCKQSSRQMLRSVRRWRSNASDCEPRERLSTGANDPSASDVRRIGGRTSTNGTSKWPSGIGFILRRKPGVFFPGIVPSDNTSHDQNHGGNSKQRPHGADPP